MDEIALLNRINDILTSTPTPEFDELYQATLTIASAVYGPSSHHVVHLLDAAKHRSRASAHAALMATLRNIKAELTGGLSGSLRAQLTGGVLSDLIQLSREVLDSGESGAGDVAAVLAAAAFEDTIRRLGDELGDVEGRPKLSEVLEALKRKGILEGAQFSIAQSYLPFRNAALHADWERIERESTASVLGFVEQLILKHFS